MIQKVERDSFTIVTVDSKQFSMVSSTLGGARQMYIILVSFISVAKTTVQGMYETGSRITIVPVVTY